MTKTIAMAILAGGIVLLIFGIDAYNSAGSDVSRLFTGSPTDKTMWLLVGGVAVTALGLAGLVRGWKRQTR